MTDDLLVGLRKKFKVWSTETTKEATKNLGKFKTLIAVKSETLENDGKLSIKTTGKNIAKRGGEVKNVARAYEYGSGKRSRSKKRSPHQTAEGFIKIVPRRRKVLAFKWEVATADPKNFKFDEEGRVLLKSVQHPGVKAANSGKGYLAPAFAKTNRKIRKELGPEVKKAVVGTFRKAFANAK